MFHNVLYRIERSQKITLLILGLLFLFLSVAWFILDFFDVKFPMEPIVVFVGGGATLFASFWPWKPTYRNARLKGRACFDYQNTNGQKFVIGRNDSSFTLQFSKADGESIHVYSDPPDISRVAIVFGAGNFEDVRDATSLEYTNRVITPSEGQIISLVNSKGFFALVNICDVKDASRVDRCDEVTFSYVINPVGKFDFS